MRDEQILRGFLAGRVDAVRQVERWARDTIRSSTCRVPVDEQADLTQITLSQIWKTASASGFALQVSFRALVRRVAAARCIDWLRRQRPRVDVEESLPDPGPSIFDQVVLRDQATRLQWALQHSGDACREILRLHFLEEKPYAEIASILQRPASTLRVRVFNCIQKLRKLLQRFEN